GRMIRPPCGVAAIGAPTGLEPLGRPVRQGQAYAIRAVDEAGEEVRVIVDARLGRIVKVIPLMEPRYAVPLLRPPAFGRPPRPLAMVPDGGIEGPEFNAPGAGGLAAGRPARAPHEPAAQAGPPLPRPHRSPTPPSRFPARGRRKTEPKKPRATRPQAASPRRPIRRRRPRSSTTTSEIRKMKAPRKPGRSLGSS